MRRSTARAGSALGNLAVREMDAQSLAFADASFDGATCRFGLMFCPDPVLAASEIRRVLRPGAHFAAAVWDSPAKNPFFMALQAVLGRFVTLPAPDPTAPGLFRLAPPGELERTLVAGGFSDVRVESFPMLWSYSSAEAYWQIQTDIAAPLHALIATMEPAAVAELKAARAREPRSAHRRRRRPPRRRRPLRPSDGVGRRRLWLAHAPTWLSRRPGGRLTADSAARKLVLHDKRWA